MVYLVVQASKVEPIIEIRNLVKSYCPTLIRGLRSKLVVAQSRTVMPDNTIAAIVFVGALD